MSETKKKEFKKTMSLNMGKVKRTTGFDPEKVEQVVEELHTPIPVEKTQQSVKKSSSDVVKKVPEAQEHLPKEHMVKTSVLVPKSRHKKLKQRALDLDTSISQYFNKLMEEDFKKAKVK